MKKVLIGLLAISSIFAENSSIERPNLNGKIDQTAEYLERIEYTVEGILTSLNDYVSIPLEQRQSNYFLSEMHQQLAHLINTLERTNSLLDHLIWLQDHKLDASLPKKNLNGRGSGG